MTTPGHALSDTAASPMVETKEISVGHDHAESVTEPRWGRGHVSAAEWITNRAPLKESCSGELQPGLHRRYGGRCSCCRVRTTIRSRLPATSAFGKELSQPIAPCSYAPWKAAITASLPFAQIRHLNSTRMARTSTLGSSMQLRAGSNDSQHAERSSITLA
jgi:hypothetical protein